MEMNSNAPEAMAVKTLMSWSATARKPRKATAYRTAQNTTRLRSSFRWPPSVMLPSGPIASAPFLCLNSVATNYSSSFFSVFSAFSVLAFLVVSSSSSSSMPSLKPFMVWPNILPSLGRFLGPKMMRTTMRIMKISVGPIRIMYYSFLLCRA